MHPDHVRENENFKMQEKEMKKKPPSIANYQQKAFTENIIAAGIIVSFLGLGCANDVYWCCKANYSYINQKHADCFLLTEQHCNLFLRSLLFAFDFMLSDAANVKHVYNVLTVFHFYYLLPKTQSHQCFNQTRIWLFAFTTYSRTPIISHAK